MRQPSTKLRCMYTNARNLDNKMEELELLMHKDCPKLGLTSHNWLATIQGYFLH